MANGIALIQAYRQAPWRKQLQGIGAFATVVLSVALVAAGYLSVTAAAARAGRAVQAAQGRILRLEQSNENLRTQLGILTSARVMQQRAEDLGFVPAEKSQLVYIQVAGYGGRPTAALAPTPQTAFNPALGLPREYTLSLFEWVQDTITLLAIQTGAERIGQP